ncbi:hypothetical protein IE077_002609 [Cardiosporidium cionae]|uniref:Magnesium transporter NIPA n=1 Tax=Cardiosporidium cionae TaxID=476202 RepID=A0ABQ7JAD6_9APIC|nr:hypothetical protein IE077_002609 [Cardiosporidium cionae]|eukprot:KAF8820967.1 hypothetical protein IE077_002609 [Cardiosporidium cionae]
MGVLDHSVKIFHEVIHSTWYIGVFCALVASFVGALGDNIVRLSFLREEKRQRKIARPYYKRPLWVFGEFLTIICNPALTLAALKFAAASIVVPFGGLHIFWNVCLCGYLLRERLSRAEIIGSIVILFGILLVVFFGTHEIPDYTVDRLISLLKQPMFIFYSVAAIFSIAFCWYFGDVEVVGTINDMLYSHAHPQQHATLHPGIARFCIAALSGITGGNGNLFAKAVVEAIHADGGSVLYRYEFYLMALFVIILCFLQALCLTIALGRYEAKFVVPMVNACLVASGSTGGILLFQEYGDLKEFDVLFFSIGVSSVIGGIFILMKGDQMTFSEENASVDDERANLIASEGSHNYDKVVLPLDCSSRKSSLQISDECSDDCDDVQA